MQAVDEQLLASGDESGTAPGDRRFRPDVEGLRAVAVGLVVVYHAGFPWVSGGYVGVDVFFVISGFVITGVLLREHSATGKTSILDFYARRSRRILPAATLTLIVTVVGAYVLIGTVSGNSAADDGRWVAVFLANFHFESIGTNYLSAARPPSPLQNYWSLSVEEQFYLVFPTLFLVAAKLKVGLSLQTRLLVVLGTVIAGSYWLSVVQTASAPTQAYFSPYTRAWELALGALAAVATPLIARVPARIAGVLTWVGLAGIVGAACTFTTNTAYPGSLVAIPVVGAALVIAGGTRVPRVGAESLLGLWPLQWLGRRSYGLYLWHWPILVLVAEHYGTRSLPPEERALLLGVALVVTAVTYRFLENPLRHLRRSSRATVATGVVTVVATVLILTFAISWTMAGTAHGSRRVVPAPNEASLLRQVDAARSMTKLPKAIQPAITLEAEDYGGFHESQSCVANATKSFADICVLGDSHGKGLLVVYGDSHTVMWLQAFDAIAIRAKWRLVILAKAGCPAEFITVTVPPGLRSPGTAYTECDQWHRRAVQWINRAHPNMVVVTQRSLYQMPSVNGSVPPYATASAWETGLREMLDAVTVPGVAKVVLGDIPLRPVDPSTCLAQHKDDVQACSTPAAEAGASSYDHAEQVAASASGARYQGVIPWFCSSVCTNVIDRFAVYQDPFHVTSTYARYLEIVLGHALRIPGN